MVEYNTCNTDNYVYTPLSYISYFMHYPTRNLHAQNARPSLFSVEQGVIIFMHWKTCTKKYHRIAAITAALKNHSPAVTRQTCTDTLIGMRHGSHAHAHANWGGIFICIQRHAYLLKHQ